MIFEIKAFKGKRPGGGGYGFGEACGKVSMRATDIDTAKWLAKFAVLLSSNDVATRQKLVTAVDDLHAEYDR